MALSRFGMGMVDPFTPYTTGRDPFDDFFTSSITPWLGGQAGALAQRAPAQQLLPPMHLDIKESDTAYELSCDAPGLNKDDIDITFEDNVLRISAERKEEKREESDRFHLQERRWGSVSRSVRLPKNADPNSINARYQDGVLRIQVGKVSEAEARKAIRVE